MGLPGRTHGGGDLFVNVVALFNQLCKRTQRLGVYDLQLCWVDPASPFLKGLGALGPCLAHSVHQPFKNLRRAVMA